MASDFARGIGVIENNKMADNKRSIRGKNNNDNFFNQMAFDFSGVKGTIDSEDLVNKPNRKKVKNNRG